MFKLFGSKKDERHIEMPQDNWLVSAVQDRGVPLVVRFNQGLTEFAGKLDYQYRFGIGVKFLDPQENGMPRNEENHRFESIEDMVKQSLEAENRGLLCAVLTGGGVKEYVAYLKNDNPGEIIEHLKTNFSQYKFTNYVVLDKKWSEYRTLSHRYRI